jgi:hypothetical protein
MRNRAKCRLCKDIIESHNTNDHVTCKCGHISVDGGNEYLRAAAIDWNNFLRVDDEGNEIEVKVKQPEVNDPLIPTKKPTKQELIKELQEMADRIEKMPPHLISLPVTHYDHYSLLLLLSAILRAS